MKRRNTGTLRAAAWVGVLALALQAYIPVHLAADIVHAVNHVLVAKDSTNGASHSHKGDGSPDPRHRDCATFMAAPGASAFMLPALVEIRRPETFVLSHAIGRADAVLQTPCPASYASRAPPAIV
jgi:hypothetical protein